VSTTSSLYVRDLAERVASTFVQAFLGALITGGVFDVAGVRDVSAWEAAGLAGVAAVLALLKGLAAKFVGQPDSASVDPQVGVLPSRPAAGERLSGPDRGGYPGGTG
jgi:hypothetical protein